LKLSPYFYGLFQVLYKIGEVAYKLDLPMDSKIHLVFHVSCVKKQVGQRCVLLPSLPPVDSHGEIQPEPEKILQRQVQKVNNQALAEVLIKWKGSIVDNATWEDFWALRSRFSHLVDKVL
jgi:hypothetical protein